jgi:hypothetical protein
MLITKGMRAKLKDTDWEKKMYATGMGYLVVNEELEVKDIVSEITKAWDFGGTFDEFGSDAGCQMVNAICKKFEEKLDFNPDHGSNSMFFELMHHMFSLIRKEATERDLLPTLTLEKS